MIQFEYYNANLLKNTALKIPGTVGQVTAPEGYAFGVLSALTNLELVPSTIDQEYNAVSVHTLNVTLPTENVLSAYIQAIEDKIIICSTTIPTASRDLVGSIYQYKGANNGSFIHGYIYECFQTSEGEFDFTPHTISCSYTELENYLQDKTIYFNDIVSGSMTYIAEGNRWKFEGKNSSDETIFIYYQFQSVWESVGFVFQGDFEDGDVVNFERTESAVFVWERIDVQPNSTIWGLISGTITAQTDLVNYITSQVTPIQTQVNTINSYIPAQASSSNQLADKNFVNSSISTNTSTFIGTFNSVAELEAYSGTVTNNDYAFVISTDTAGNTIYNRYKYTTATTPGSWQFEYALNNSSFTVVQWAAINSGATTANIAQITLNTTNISTHVNNTNNPHSVTKSQVGLGNVDNTSDLNKPISTATQTALNGKQDTISDLSTIRSNAQAGKSASDTIATYGDIVTHDVAEFATAAQGAKADTALQAGDNVSELVNDAGYLVMSDLTNFVTKNTAQTISGLKTFSADIILSGTTSIKNTTNSVSYTMLYRDASGIHVGTTTQALLLAGSNARPTFNNNDIAMLSDVPTTLAALTGDVSISSPSNGEHLVYDGVAGKWKNTASAATVSWGGITGTLSNQTDLQNALDGKVAKGHEVIAFQEPTSQNNYTWYRLYDDGWVEQGGQFTQSGNSAIEPSLTFPIELADNNYMIVWSAGASGLTAGTYFAHQVVQSTKTTTGCQVKTGNNNTNFTVLNWYVCYMAA